MLFKILKKDFKRKRAMNIILFIFMLTAGILIASSTNLLYSTLTAVDYFTEKSDVADVISITNANHKIKDAISEWTGNSKLVKDNKAEKAVVLDEKKVATSTGKELRNTSMLFIMTKPEKYNLIFDRDGKNFDVGPSQVAIPVSIQKKLDLSVGDRLTIEINGYSQELTVSTIFKDVVFGAEIMGMKRFILNESDFNQFNQNTPDKFHYILWGFSKNAGYQNKDLEKAFSDLSLPTETIMGKDMIRVVYLLDMVLAAVMILVSIFLILISFLILRFTIVFTVMEDYKQIGVMKAIGLRNGKIKRIYSIKYFTLSAISGAIAFVISFPVTKLMKQNISDYILLKQSLLNYIIALISILLVVGITMLFCNYSTGKIKRISAIDAIRQGSSGERFSNTKKLKLSRRGKMNIPLFLACSDIISDFKKFIILIITFILGTVIIMIPNNIITTLSSDNTITLFGFSDSDFYIRDDFLGDQQDAIERMNKIETEFSEKGISTNLSADLNTYGKIYTVDKSNSIGMLSFQGIGIGSDQFQYLEGTAPELINEIAVTEKVADYLNVNIGDIVICELQGIKNEFIITALFQSLNNLGHCIRLSDKYRAEEGRSTSITISGNFVGTSKEKQGQFDELKKEFPDMNIRTGKEVVNTFIGYITKQVGALKNLILFLVIGINFLITTLLLRMLISKEVPEIAILKSLGFQSIYVKKWQLLRIGIILAISIIIGTILANTTGNILVSGIFKIMGITRLHLMTEPKEVFLIYPVALFAATMLAVILSLGQIKKTHVWELNNQE